MSTSASMNTSKRRKSLSISLQIVIVFVFATGVRGAFLWQFRSGLYQDPDAYREIAENILQHGIFGRGGQGDSPRLAKDSPSGTDLPLAHDSPRGNYSPPEKLVISTAYRPPLYPLLLTLLRTADTRHVSLAKVAVVHLLLGLATIYMTWFCAWRFCGMPQWQAAVASLIVAGDPILLYQQSLVMTETLATFLAALALTCLAFWSERPSLRSAALSGLTLGLASLCRPTFLPWLVVVAVAIAVAPRVTRSTSGEIEEAEGASTNGRTKMRFIARRLALACVVAGSALAVMLPWGLRNAWVFGQPILTTTHGGYTLELGNNPDFYDWLSSEKELPWDSRAWQAKRRSALRELPVDGPPELVWDRWAYHRAWQTIRQRPGDFVRASLYRVLQLWSALPHRLMDEESAARQAARWVVAGWYCAVYLLAAYGVARLGRKLLAPPWLWGVLLVATWMGVHTLYWTNLRMRAPLIPLLALLAGRGAETGRAALRALRRALHVVRGAKPLVQPL